MKKLLLSYSYGHVVIKEQLRIFLKYNKNNEEYKNLTLQGQ